jgi:transposase
VCDQPEGKQKKKGTDKDKEEKQIVTSVKWAVKEGVDINARSGIYFLRTSLQAKREENVWQFYNIIREIEATFRVLKSDLDLRPIYHQKDENTMAHLHLGLLAYWLVNKYKYAPFVKRKSVVHKSELEKCQFIEQQEFHSD